MMNYKRRVRIIGRTNELEGYKVDVQDAETGESIPNVARAVIVLRPTEINVAILTMFREDPNTHRIIAVDGDVKEDLVRANLPEIDITALELLLQEDVEEK
jgi:hypothetical protein